MNSKLPKYEAPPVVETVLSAQFARIEKYTNAHGGWFWKDYLSADWISVQSQPRLDDQFERFGEDQRWGPSSGGIRVIPGAEPERLQVLRADDEGMIQIQDSRFVYNWRKQQADYPSYDRVLVDFKEKFAAFEKFIKDAKLGEVQLNQWEVTYVNHIERGALWDNVHDWMKIFPRFSVLTEATSGFIPEDFRGEWRVLIGDDLGRLYVSMIRGRIGMEKGSEFIRLQLTARGPVIQKIGRDLWSGFDAGHAAIVRYFTDMTSSMAHSYWKRSV